MLGVDEHMDLKLFGREIIFEEFKPIWTRYLIVTDRRTDRQTNRRKQSNPHRAVKMLASLLSLIAKGFNHTLKCKNGLIIILGFLPRDTTQKAVRHNRPCLSVSPSVCLSVHLYVCDVQVCFHTGWNTSKIISRPNNLRYLLTLPPTWVIWSNGNRLPQN